MKRILTLSIVCWSVLSYGQQLPQFSQFQRNQVVANPGAAGAYDFLDVTLGGRYQWLGFSNEQQGAVSPRTAYLYGATILKMDKTRYNPALRVSNGPIASPKVGTGKLKHALGGQVLMDEYGAFRNTQVALLYAVHVPVSQSTNISLGAKLGFDNHSFLDNKAQTLSSMTTGITDDSYTAFLQNNGSRWIMDLGLGIYAYSDKFYAGISADQLTKDFVDLGSGTANFDPQMHFQAIGGFNISLNQNLTLMPGAMVKFMQPAPISWEITSQLDYKRWLWVGLGYRHTDAIIGMIGGNISQRFKIGYSYDFALSSMRSYSTGGHELTLGLMFR